METLSGYSISQFSVFGQSNRISAGDRFFTSQVICQPAVYKEYESKSLEYGLLIEQLFADLSASFGFKSMAYELSDGYARSNHAHEYNSFDISAEYGSSTAGGTRNTALATFRVGDKKIRMYMPCPWAWKAPDPEIGELKFKMLPTIAQRGSIDIHAADFDGWVYPFGQTYTVAPDEFRAAKECFDGCTDTSLSIPNINRFIKADPRPGAVMAEVGFGNTGVPPHCHSSQIALNGGNAKIILSVAVTQQAGYDSGIGGKLHSGADGYKKKKYYKSTLHFAAQRINVGEYSIGDSESNLNREQYPSHNQLPVMIYIGKKQQ